MPGASSRLGVRSCSPSVSLGRGLTQLSSPHPHPQEPSDAVQAVNRKGGTVGAAGSRGRGETCGHVVSMAPACQILRWALALGLGLTFEVTHAFRSQGRGGPGASVGREQEVKEGSVRLGLPLSREESGEAPGSGSPVLQLVAWIQEPVGLVSPALQTSSQPGPRGPSQGPPQASDPRLQMSSCPAWRTMRSPSPPEWMTTGHCWPSRPLPPGGSAGAQGLQQSPVSSTRWLRPAPTSC